MTASLPESIILPPGLDPSQRDELASLWLELAPRTAFERFLVTRLIQAAARLHLSAAREPDGPPDPLWLRYEAAADRLFRQSLNALRKLRAEHPTPANPEPQTATPPTAHQPNSPPHLPISPAPAPPKPHSLRPRPATGQDVPVDTTTLIERLLPTRSAPPGPLLTGSAAPSPPPAPSSG
ncbi:MAG: hypothetical protein KatS3mg108_0981 [Isosphaeraceae bacterium]|nr:MAG: hypothetical protein KatS3mg108_0981 [Isosphaeraceae bacterium]